MSFLRKKPAEAKTEAPTATAPTPIQRWKDAVRHASKGGTMAQSDLDEIYAFLEKCEADNAATSQMDGN